MTGRLAIHGGKPIVPEGLKKTWPEITQEDKDAVLGVLERNIFTGEEHGPEANALEREWAEFNGSKYAMARRDFVTLGRKRPDLQEWVDGILERIGRLYRRNAERLNSGTASIHTALFAGGVGPGDEVITSAFSFSGTFQPILQQHAIPIFVEARRPPQLQP